MKKTVFVTLAVFLGVAVQAGQVARPALSGSISERVAQRANRQASTLKSSADFEPQTSTQQRQKAITQALRKVTSQPGHTITWKQFLQAAKTTADSLSLRGKNENKAFLSFLTTVEGAEKALGKTYDANQGFPDYAQETRGAKYIYVGEAGQHNDEQNINHVLLLIKQVRLANPGARILLASEFAVRTFQFQTPVCFASGGCDIGSVSDKYNLFHQEIHTNVQIDILALDNYFTNRLWPEVGDTSVSYDIDDPSFQSLLAEYWQIDPELSPYYIAMDVISTSDWGTIKRNEQWARYISSVSEYYDIIIVYAGNGHMEMLGNKNLRDMLPGSCIKVDVEPLQLSATGTGQLQLQLSNATVKQGLACDWNNDFCNDDAAQKSAMYLETILQKETEQKGIDPEKYYYIKITDVQDPSLYKKYVDIYKATTGADYRSCRAFFLVYM